MYGKGPTINGDFQSLLPSSSPQFNELATVQVSNVRVSSLVPNTFSNTSRFYIGVRNVYLVEQETGEVWLVNDSLLPNQGSIDF